MKNHNDQILGSLVGAAVGEAMGAATETWNTEMILKEYGGYVTDIKKPPLSTHAMGKTPAGQVTGGFSFAYLLTQQILKDGGNITGQTGSAALAQWLETPQAQIYMGPTTKKASQRLQGIPVEDRHPFLTCNHHNATNEAATRAFVFGLFYPGEPDKAIDAAIEGLKDVHGNVTALSGACAVAAATAAALKTGAEYYDVLMAGVYGSRQGYDRAYARGLQPASGALVERRIELAIEVGMKHRGDFDSALAEIEQIVGNGLSANESVAAAFGCIAASGGDAVTAVKLGVNLGNDTDAIAGIAGAITGALCGAGAFSRSDLDLINSVNGVDLEALAGQIVKILPLCE